MKRIKPGDKVALTLTFEERDLVIAETLAPESLCKYLRMAEVKGKRIIARFTLDDLDELGGFVAAAPNHAPNATLDKKLLKVFEKIDTLLCTYTDEPEELSPLDRMMGIVDPGDDKISGDDFLPHPKNDFEQFVAKMVKEKDAATIEILNEELANASERYNNQPQAEMGGLSPEQVGALIYVGWDQEDGVLRLNEKLTAADLSSVPILHNTKVFLATLQNLGKSKATAINKNLNRKLVGELIGTMHWAEHEVEDCYYMNKAVNEEDFFPLHLLRITLQRAGLIRLAKGFFTVTKKGTKYLAATDDGPLFAHLFRTFFLRVNLAYLDGMEEVPDFQQTIAFTFYMFGKLGGSWKKPEELAPPLLLPSVHEYLPRREFSDSAQVILSTRFITPMEFFGLLEKRYLPEEGPYRQRRFEVRKKPLYDLFLKFDFKNGQNPLHKMH